MPSETKKSKKSAKKATIEIKIKKAKIPKKVGGYKIPKEVRREGNKVILALKDLLATEIAATAINVLARNSARRRGPSGES